MFRRITGLIVISAALVVAAAGPAWAPRVHLLPGYTGPCTAQVEGAVVSGSFNGQASVVSYDAKENTLTATILVNGTCTAAGQPFSIADATSSTQATVTAASCTELRIRLGAAPVKDVVVDLSGADMVLIAEKRDRGLFCRIANARLKQGAARTAADLNALLNR